MFIKNIFMICNINMILGLFISVLEIKSNIPLGYMVLISALARRLIQGIIER